MHRTLPLPVLSVLSLQQTTSSTTDIRTTNTSRMARIVDSALTAGMHPAPERWDNSGTVSNRAAQMKRRFCNSCRALHAAM